MDNYKYMYIVQWKTRQYDKDTHIQTILKLIKQRELFESKET